jgi:hypothetical protein
MPGIFGSSTPPRQTVTSQQKLPGWVEKAGRQNYTDVRGLTNRENFRNPYDDPSLPDAGGVLGGPYMGGMVPNQSQETLDAYGMVRQGAGQGRTAIQGGIDAAMRGANYQPTQVGGNTVTTPYANAASMGAAPTAGAAAMGPADRVQAQNFLSGNIGAYMSPYIENVENAALSNIERQRLTANNANADAAIGAGAFGGSRHAIREAVTNAESARAAGEMSANLRQQGFNTAAGIMQGDQGRALQADLANQGANLQTGQANAGFTQQSNLANQQAMLAANRENAGFQQQAALANQQAALAANTKNADLSQNAQIANQTAGTDQAKTAIQGGTVLGSLGQGMQQNWLQGAAALQGVGSAREAYDLAGMQDKARLYETFRQARFENPNVRQQFLQGTPYGQTTSTTGPATTAGYNPLLGGLGGASTGLSIASSLGYGGTTAGGLGLGSLGALVGLFSDRRAKTDIQKLGKDGSGLDMYAYRYKGDPKSYPKVVGPMAQDVEKKHPGSVGKIGGHRVIRNPLAGRMAG